MEPEASRSWLALTLTPGIAARLSSRLLREFGTPDGVFHASLSALEACNLPAPAAQAIFSSGARELSSSQPDHRRNAFGVLIIEGKQYSGSLITAQLAMEFGREVYGVPGNVTQEMSFAPNQLFKQGAKLVTDAEDVIEELPTPGSSCLGAGGGGGNRATKFAGLRWAKYRREKDLRATEC